MNGPGQHVPGPGRSDGPGLAGRGEWLGRGRAVPGGESGLGHPAGQGRGRASRRGLARLGSSLAPGLAVVAGLPGLGRAMAGAAESLARALARRVAQAGRVRMVPGRAQRLSQAGPWPGAALAGESRHPHPDDALALAVGECRAVRSGEARAIRAANLRRRRVPRLGCPPWENRWACDTCLARVAWESSPWMARPQAVRHMRDVHRSADPFALERATRTLAMRLGDRVRHGLAWRVWG